MTHQRTWDLLERRASGRVEETLTALIKAKKQVQELADSQARLGQMIGEYNRRLAALQMSAHSIGQVGIYQNYIEQVETLCRRLAATQQVAERQVAAAADAHREAETERARMEYLAQAETQRALQRAQRQDQRAMDAIAIARHQVRQP
jgi:flagellar export protein FliJ